MAGNGRAGFADGSALTASFHSPYSVCVHTGRQKTVRCHIGKAHERILSVVNWLRFMSVIWKTIASEPYQRMALSTHLLAAVQRVSFAHYRCLYWLALHQYHDHRVFALCV